MLLAAESLFHHITLELLEQTLVISIVVNPHHEAFLIEDLQAEHILAVPRMISRRASRCSSPDDQGCRLWLRLEAF